MRTMHPTIDLKAANPVIAVDWPSQADWAALMRKQGQSLDSMIAKLVSGEYSPMDWYEAMYQMLVDGHAGSRALGRQRAGDLAALDVDDFLAARGIADRETEWLFKFLDALQAKDGRYWDDDTDQWKAQAIRNRSRLYVGKMRGTAGQAFVSASEDTAEFNWVMAATEHCNECPVLAAKSPWYGGELFTTPGSGLTPCRTNCKCHLVREDGVTSFKPVSI